MADHMERATKRRRLGIDNSENTRTSPMKSPNRHKQSICASPLKTRNSPRHIESTTPSKFLSLARINLCSPNKNGKTESGSPAKRKVVDSPAKRKDICSPTKSPRLQKQKLSHNMTEDLDCTPTQSLPGADVMSIDPLLSPIGITPNKLTQLPPVEDYDPTHCLRCHTGGSKSHPAMDPTDDRTQIWKCAFEPDPNRIGTNTGIVATCGGRTICLIDCNSGKVLKRYTHKNEEFFAVAWTTVTLESNQRQWESNILAAVGLTGEVYLFHPEMLVAYHSFSVTDNKKNIFINALMFHPEKKSFLFCGGGDGCVYFWDIGIPTGANYKASSKLLGTLDCKAKVIYALVYDAQTPCLLAATDDGCHVWNFNKHRKPTNRNASKHVTLRSGQDTLVDTMCLVNKDCVATKVVKSGVIQLWKLSDTINQSGKQVKPILVTNLKWSDTDAFFIGIDYCKKGLLCSGDADGRIWLYNISKLSKKTTTHPKSVCGYSERLLWPICDINSGKEEDLKMTDVVDDQENDETPIINTTHISSDGRYIVCGTQNNLLCIWSGNEG